MEKTTGIIKTTLFVLGALVPALNGCEDLVYTTPNFDNPDDPKNMEIFVEATGTIETLPIRIDDPSPDIEYGDDGRLRVTTFSEHPDTIDEYVEFAFRTDIWQEGETYRMPEVGGDGLARITVTSSIVEEIHDFAGYNVTGESYVTIRGLSSSGAELTMDVELNSGDMIESEMSIRLPARSTASRR